MRFLVRWAFRLLILAIVLGVALVLLKDTILKALAERQLRQATGMDVRIGRLQTGFGVPTLTLEDLKIYNTADFGGSPFLDMPELHIECDPAALSDQKLRIKLLRFTLTEVNIVESRDGRTNIIALMEQLEKQTGGQKPSSGTNSMFGFEFGGIDLLNLTVGKVKYVNLRVPGKNMEFDVGLKNEILTNVRSSQDFAGLLLRIVFRRGLSIMTGGSGGPLEKQGSGARPMPGAAGSGSVTNRPVPQPARPGGGAPAVQPGRVNAPPSR